MNLIEGIQQEQKRVRELLTMYEEIPQGAFGAIMLKQVIAESEKAIASGDIVLMVQCLAELKECE